MNNAKRLHANLSALGYQLGAPASPVIAVMFDDRLETLHFWHNLLDLGIYTNLMLPPATPKGTSLIRCSVSAAHTTEQIDAISSAFARLRKGANVQLLDNARNKTPRRSEAFILSDELVAQS